MSKFGACCQSRTWDCLRALKSQLCELSLALGCIFLIKLLRAKNRVRELSWAHACTLVHDRVHLIERPDSILCLMNMYPMCIALQGVLTWMLFCYKTVLKSSALNLFFHVEMILKEICNAIFTSERWNEGPD